MARLASDARWATNHRQGGWPANAGAPSLESAGGPAGKAAGPSAGCAKGRCPNPTHGGHRTSGGTESQEELKDQGAVWPPASGVSGHRAAPLPRRFGGYWAMLRRPLPASGGAHIWISFSPDLRNWGPPDLD